MKRAKETLDDRINAILDELEDAWGEFDQLVRTGNIIRVKRGDLPKLVANRERRESLETEFRYKLDLYTGGRGQVGQRPTS